MLMSMPKMTIRFINPVGIISMELITGMISICISTMYAAYHTIFRMAAIYTNILKEELPVR